MVRAILVEFDNALNDTEWNDAGDIVVPGGKRLINGVRQCLISKLIDVSNVSQRGFYGWEVTIRWRSHSYKMVIQRTDRWLIVVGDETTVLRRLLSLSEASRALKELATKVTECLDSTGIGKNLVVIEEN